jgi:pyruvate formate lyase activating enzyme
MYPALLSKTLSDGTVLCCACAHFCRLPEGTRGQCGVRAHHQGRLVSLVGHRVAALHVDPIEKKPLFHFLPGSTTLSLGTQGCNFRCAFCQNWTLSCVRGPIQGEEVPPQRLVEAAQDLGCASIAFTYSEPTVFLELVVETADAALPHGLKLVLVSNGFQSPQTLRLLHQRIHAANIDLKGPDRFYRTLCGGRLAVVQRNLMRMRQMGWHVEVTTLVIPGHNDADADLVAIARFLARELGPETPWHVSRFHPCHKMPTTPPTPLETLLRARDIGREEGLRYVFVGNVRQEGLEDTVCPECGATAIARYGFSVTLMHLKSGRCSQCGTAILPQLPEHDPRGGGA